ncbi:hypothetical protein [Kribbella sancticallisti]
MTTTTAIQPATPNRLGWWMGTVVAVGVHRPGGLLRLALGRR